MKIKLKNLIITCFNKLIYNSVVIGSGATAVTLCPSIADESKLVTMVHINLYLLI